MSGRQMRTFNRELIMQRKIDMRILTIVILCVAGLAQAESRIALVIGNGSYSNSPLVNPSNDASLIAGTLGDLGFEVNVLIDGDQRAMKMAVRDGADKSIGVFYYAGHGIQSVGRNFLIPIAAELADEADLDIEAVEAQAIVSQMENAGNQLNILNCAC